MGYSNKFFISVFNVAQLFLFFCQSIPNNECPNIICGKQDMVFIIKILLLMFREFYYYTASVSIRVGANEYVKIIP